ncbi:hypothetical protein N0V93_009982 [Gnomoniopsis smithogilvyi]|uniref:Rhodopsin domain-containing protein n=1 Tax=Gnomoniopsis smithogilvyi TaxID=1191159 RepID=A0A9W9CRX2_9PEZI|nr:hypothetical protein N0V93_009982 [Gnomoniopsis smithogilvyi]
MVKLSGGIYIARLTNQFWASKSLTSNTSGGRALKSFLSKYLNRLFYTFLGLSYIAVVTSEAAECRPFNHYWQVTPTATLSCRVAPANLFITGGLDIFTDLTLVALPVPMILNAKIPTKLKLETFFLVLFPLVNVAFTCYRLPTLYARDGAQRYRTLLASIDILVSTASANALVVVSFLKDRGFKKLKYRHREGEDDDPLEHVISTGMELESMDNGNSTTHSAGPFSKRRSPLPSPRRPTWGSDEDLMHDDSDGGPSTHTTSTRDAEIDTGPDVVEQDASILVLNDTGHLSPHIQAETSIVAAHQVEKQGRRKTVTRPASPSASRTSLQSGIVVETSWQVDVTQK